MKLPIIWLRDYVKTDLSAQEIADILNRIGFEVEEIISSGEEAVLDVSVTPNRPDCNSVLGLSREIAAYLGAEFTMPDLSYQVSAVSNPVKTEVNDSELCPRYTGAYVFDVKVGQSPDRIAKRLKLAGLNTVNNIVDITNFVLLEFGQPLHAFDAKTIEGNTVIVRRADNGEKITTLDGKEHTLTGEVLLISDKSKAIAVAGIMGGQNSLITEKTAAVFVESAVFNHVSIRKTSRKLGIRSDSSARFEKSVDTFSCEYALHRALNLIEATKSGKICEGIVDIATKSAKTPNKPVKINTDQVTRLLGIEIASAEMERILNNLQMKTKRVGKTITVYPPYWRTDISLPCDIAEEIIRIYGYDKIMPTLLEYASVTKGGLSDRQKTVAKIKEFLVSAGFFETVTLSFAGRKLIEKTGVDFASVKNTLVPILNPLGEDFAYLRQNNTGNLLNVVSLNFARRNEPAAYFEVANNFSLCDGNINVPAEEKLTLTAVSAKDDFYYFKEVVEAILKIAGKEAYFIKSSHSSMHPGICADIIVNGEAVGSVGQIHPKVAANFDINKNITLLEINIDALTQQNAKSIRYEPVSKFPSVTRDISLLLKTETEVGALLEFIRQKAPDILRGITLTDLYTGEQIKEGKSATIKLEFLSVTRTLQQSEVDDALVKILEKLNTGFGAVLRS